MSSRVMCKMAMFRRAVSTRFTSFAAGGACLGLLSVGMLAGCTAQQSQPQTSAAAAETLPESAGVEVAPECVNAEDQHVECLADSDCCAGFVCGKDPELSPRVSYCIYGG